MTEQNSKPTDLQSPQFEVKTIENRVNELRAKISDLAVEVDAHRANIARCVGGGVFLFSLAALAAYDLLTGKSGLWLSIGVTQANLLWVAIALGGVSLAAFAYALMLDKKRDYRRENRMAELEQELEQLLKRRASLDKV
jgi:hypothetical protein